MLDMSPNTSVKFDALAGIDTGQLLIDLGMLESMEDDFSDEISSAQESETAAVEAKPYAEQVDYSLKPVISPDETVLRRASAKNHIDQGISRGDAIRGTTLRWCAAMITNHQEHVRARRTAIIAEALRSGEDPRSHVWNRRLLMQEIAGARSQDLTPEDVIKKARFEPSQFPALRYAADAFVPSKRRRRLVLAGLAVTSLWLVAGKGGTEVSSADSSNITQSNAAGALAMNENESAMRATDENLTAAEPTTPVSTTTTIAPKPTITPFQLGLAEPLTIRLEPGTTSEQSAVKLTEATQEQWDAATFEAYIGKLPADYPGGEVRPNDCQGADVDLVRAGDTFGGIARDNGMNEQQLTELNEDNVMLARAGLCIRVGEGNKGVKAEGA